MKCSCSSYFLFVVAVVDDTPILFQPITETVEEAFVEAISIEESIEEAIGSVL